MGVRGAKILEKLPDIPRWLYARWMVLSGQARIFSSEGLNISSSIIQHPTNGLTCVIGKPEPELFRYAAELEDVNIRFITYGENDRYVEEILQGWSRSLAYLHILEDDIINVHVQDPTIRFLESKELTHAEHIPADLRGELLDAIHTSPIATLFVNDIPVSFCYAAAETESLWDISVDTLEGYRGRGYAFRTVIHMINYMNERGKRPVWGAEETNDVSIGLARKLGFKPIETIYLYEDKL